MNDMKDIILTGGLMSLETGTGYKTGNTPKLNR